MAITHKDVRYYLLDRTVEDNDLDLDLSFSPDEIEDAMKRAARAYNSVPPFVGSVTWNNLPDDTNLFLDAIAEQLYLSLLAKLTRNDIDYVGGDVQINLVAKRIAHLKELIKDHRARWRETARDIKVAANLSKAFVTFY